jgi:hypothetical protein
LLYHPVGCHRNTTNRLASAIPRRNVTARHFVSAVIAEAYRNAESVDFALHILKFGFFLLQDIGEILHAKHPSGESQRSL